jgi:hypothetical protein
MKTDNLFTNVDWRTLRIIPALSMTQPWATLWMLLEKRIETRSWKTKYRGPVAVHAAKGFPMDCRDLCDTPPFREVLRAHGLGASDLPLGKILCISSIQDCLPTEKISQAWCYYSEAIHEEVFGDYSPGRFGFLLGGIDKVFDPPIPAVGHLGLWGWKIPDEVRR